MLTDTRILELIEQNHLTLGMYPPPQLVPISDTHFGFRSPPGMTYYGESLMAFARSICEECRVECDAIRDGEAER